MRLNKATPNVTVAKVGCISEGSIRGTILSSRTEKEGEGRRKRLKKVYCPHRPRGIELEGKVHSSYQIPGSPQLRAKDSE